MINLGEAKKVLMYDPATGAFIWIARCSNRTKIGSLAGTISSEGYRVITVHGVRHYAHRLAWAWMTGSFPIGLIDHKNKDRLDNRIDNLRAATHKQNAENSGIRSHNTSGIKGVTWAKDRCKWVAQIHHNGKHKTLGYFDDPKTASDAYQAAANSLFTHHPEATT